MGKGGLPVRTVTGSQCKGRALLNLDQAMGGAGSRAARSAWTRTSMARQGLAMNTASLGNSGR